MQKIKYLTEQSVKELEDWVKSHPEGSDAYYQDIRRELQSLLMMTNLEQATQKIHYILYLIADVGPLNSDFLPSFDQLASYLIAREEKQKNSKSN